LSSALKHPTHHDAVQDALPDLTACPHCQAEANQLALWGWSRGLRRYRCKQCHRTCNALSGSPLAKLR
ncbi:IS1/IS1595 family N-terminal zinc-binding domain-containing protein, partial [Chromobacterium alticapitis]